MEAGTTVDAATLPAEWSVDVSDETFTISTAPLRAYFQSGPKKQQGAEVRAWLELLAASLDSGTTAESDPSAAVKLKRILARPEFRPPNPPSEWELFWKEFGRWVEALLDKLFGFTGRHPGSIQLFLWALLVGASGVLVYLLMHTWRHETRASPLSPGRLPDPSLNSEAWIAAAQSARRKGDIAGSIQCCYWAGVTHLQEAGTLPPHFAHTPREHLRLLAGQQELRAALSILCTRLERCWYARATPDDQDLTTCFGALKELGCAVD
ncbi:DUF4129 domain-containing protein [Paludibaculum fermentans]|uniref:DUF4129 domain-containing protein n=1 Tax=Paludibaculum fermentans TaxID=1473598 RepID=A0A7S7NPH8_PALFE|nr:DUF4129 domain-containing protein [Paludibaculum fermentans]QOY87406.1 DUF4129 domain-containing protein [Paludibaculum fermentans]